MLSGRSLAIRRWRIVHFLSAASIVFLLSAVLNLFGRCHDKREFGAPFFRKERIQIFFKDAIVLFEAKNMSISKLKTVESSKK